MIPICTAASNKQLAAIGEPNGGSARAYEALDRSHSVRTGSPTRRFRSPTLRYRMDVGGRKQQDADHPVMERCGGGHPVGDINGC